MTLKGVANNLELDCSRPGVKQYDLPFDAFGPPAHPRPSIMSESIANSSEQRRPTASRTNSESLRARPANTRSTSMDKSNRQVNSTGSLQASTHGGPAPSGPLQEPKAKKKPRKLAIRNNNSIEVETNETSLDSRVSALESEYRKLHKRTNSNTAEIGKLQASTRTAPAMSKGDRPQTIGDASFEEKEIEQLQVDPASPSADQYRSTRPIDLNPVEELSDDEIETIPRPTAPAIGEPTERNQSVALKGSYKIPLPSTLSTDDVRAVQSGFSAASTVAREIATAIRASRSRKDSALNETEKDKEGPAATKSTSSTNVDTQLDVSSPRSWTSLLNSCTKLVSNAANVIEMEAAVEAKRSKSLHPERTKQQTTYKRADNTHPSSTRASTRQRPATRTNSNTFRPEGLKPTTTRRTSSATAPTQSSARKNSTRAMGPMLTTQAGKRNVPRDSKSMDSQRPRIATKAMSSQSNTAPEQ